MRYKIIQTIPTNLGRSVHVARDEQGTLVLIKCAHTPEWIDDLHRQSRHYLTMSRLLAEQSIYPEVLQIKEDELIIPYYEYGTIDDLTLGHDSLLITELTKRSLHYLFDIAAKQMVIPHTADHLHAAKTYLREEASSRLKRLQRALTDTEQGVQWASRHNTEMALSFHEIVTKTTSWIYDGWLATASSDLGPPLLGLASHGDFVLSNIMLATSPSPNAQIVFIDTRGHWYGGLPWWDPIMDLATFIAFHCRIEPVIGKLTTSADDPQEPFRFSEQEILELCRADQAFQRWIESDLFWYERLQIEIAIRLLGSISVQLLTTPKEQIRRATAVLHLYIEQLSHMHATCAHIAGKMPNVAESRLTASNLTGFQFVETHTGKMK